MTVEYQVLVGNREFELEASHETKKKAVEHASRLNRMYEGDPGSRRARVFKVTTEEVDLEKPKRDKMTKKEAKKLALDCIASLIENSLSTGAFQESAELSEVDREGKRAVVKEIEEVKDELIRRWAKLGEEET